MHYETEDKHSYTNKIVYHLKLKNKLTINSTKQAHVLPAFMNLKFK